MTKIIGRKSIMKVVFKQTDTLFYKIEQREALYLFFFGHFLPFPPGRQSHA
jgi:hypothetical protein